MRWFISLAATLAAIASFGCGSGSPSSPSGAGSLRLMITDSPYSDAKAVLVTFSEVSAHVSSGESGGRTALKFAGDATSRTCDLKKLEQAQDVLGVGTLPAGHYTMIRLVVSRAALYFDNALPADAPACAATVTPPAGRSATLTIPSGEVKLNREFDVAASGATTILLDFDGDRSIHEQGNGGFRMTPVIGVVSVQ
jgi:hypothetical protein